MRFVSSKYTYKFTKQDVAKAKHLLKNKKSLNLTCSQIAKMIGCSRWTLYQWSKGRCNLGRPAKSIKEA